MATPQPSPPPPACAACRHQRRKCPPDCPMAPYFPADQAESFSNVQRLFCVSNIVEILKEANPADRDKAIESFKFEADAWAEDPVYGASGVLAKLERELKESMAELASLNRELAACRRRYPLPSYAPASSPPPPEAPYSSSPGHPSSSPCLRGGGAGFVDDTGGATDHNGGTTRPPYCVETDEGCGGV